MREAEGATKGGVFYYSHLHAPSALAPLSILSGDFEAAVAILRSDKALVFCDEPLNSLPP